MEIKEYTRGNVIVKVYRPDITDKELKKRLDTITIALQHIGKEMEETKWRR